MDKRPKTKSLNDISSCPLKEIAPNIEPKKTLIVTDRTIHGLYGKDFPESSLAFLPEGEAAKSWDELARLFRRFIALEIDRTWTILAIGGGTVSDVSGFAAHSWMRGIRFVCAPTTLLAMTDAALGGKNGIDFEGYKNVIGSFHQPAAIFCDIGTLRSLSHEQFSSGMAEVIKHAMIDGETYFAFLESALEGFSSSGRFDHETCPGSLLERLVEESQRIKLDIVDRDPKEAGERRILNLGHTFGHAIEAITGKSHGASVSLGIILACGYSNHHGGMEESAMLRVSHLLSGFGLPTDTSFLSNNGLLARVANALFMDKKREGDFMNLVIPKDIGSVRVEKVPTSELKAYLEEGVK
ncbi:MAG TPA: 3-dehydroquinate synthase family protein [Rectinemataceae bacterium]|nr:3-dehydroquinate synthase family protein [Rectinemataceae bacterium]